MFEFLPKTMLLGGPRHGDFWVVDNAAPPLLTFDVPGGGYERHVEQRIDTTTGLPQARVFYRHAQLSDERAQALAHTHWQQGMVIAYGHDARFLIGIPSAPAAAPKMRAARPPEVEELMRHRSWGVIRAWRVHRNLSQADVAASLGLETSIYAQLEAHPVRIAPEVLTRIAEVLSVPLAQLLD